MEKLLILKKFLTMQNYQHFKLFGFKKWLYFKTIYILKITPNIQKEKITKTMVQEVFTYMSNICILKIVIERLHKNYNQQPQCLRGFLFRNLLQLIKVKLAFHIMLDIIIRNNYQMSNQPLNIQIFFHFWDKLLYVFLENKKGRCR